MTHHDAHLFAEVSLKYKTSQLDCRKICSSRDSEFVFRFHFDQDTMTYKEDFYVIYLNRANKAIHFMHVSSGGLSGTVVDVRMIFSAGLLCGATSMVVAHNHPSGSLRPSQLDDKMTKQLVEAGKLMNITVLDHLILTETAYYSYADEGRLK